MTKDEALKLALSTLDEVRSETFRLLRNGQKLYAEEKVWKTVFAIKEALAQPEYNTTSDPCLMENAQGDLERINLVQTGVGIGKPAQQQEPVAKVVSTAPERIWLDLGFDPEVEDEISFDDLFEATWSHDNATGNGIEYVRADLAPASKPWVGLTDEQREKLRDAFAQALTSVYVCGRVWEAWQYGTMSEGDFQPAGECEEVLDSLIEAAHGIKE